MPRSLPMAALSATLCLSPICASAQDRPVMKHPVLCGQSWAISTYETHSPDPDSIDFYYWRERDTKEFNETENLTGGQYVLASAAGEIIRDDIVPDDDNGQVRRVRILHKDGFVTSYLHLIIEPPFLELNRKVAMGEVIGRAGRSGTFVDNQHIHYTQRDPTDAGIRAEFDRQPVATHAGAEETWSLVKSPEAEELTSANCTAAQFVRWRQGGETYIFRYRPRERQARITRLNADGNGGTNTWSGSNWGRSWTHFANWRGTDGGRYLLRYSAPRGKATFFRIEPDGSGLTKLRDTASWQQRWTIIKRAAHFDQVYLITYDSLTGYQQIRIVSEDNDTAAVTHVMDDVRGWTHILPFDQNGKQYLLYYKGASGRMQIRRLRDVSASDKNGTDLELEKVYDNFHNPGWTHLTLARDAGTLFMVGFRATNGRSRIWRIGAPSDGPEGLDRFTLNRKWDIITAYRQGNQARLFFYGIDAGDSATFDVDDQTGALSQVATFSWQAGWR